VSISDSAEVAVEDVGVDLRQDIDQVAAAVGQHLDLPSGVSVSVGVHPENAITGTGVGGRTSPSNGHVTISLDPSVSYFKQTLNRWLPLLLSHELDHAVRIIDGPGYGTTLLEAIVSEGLADSFSLETYPQPRRPHWVTALAPNAVDVGDDQIARGAALCT